MSRIATAPLYALAITLALTTGCEQGTESSGFSGYTVDAGECEGTNYDKEYDTAAPEPMEVSAEVDGQDVLLHLDNLDANCCPSPDAVITLDGFDMLVEFDDVTSGDPCDCMCVTDFLVTIEDLDAGSYSIDVDYNGGIIATVEVEIEG
jgi:hypothetical protein